MTCAVTEPSVFGLGTIFGTVVGLFIPAVLQNGFVIVGVQPFWEQVAVGAHHELDRELVAGDRLAGLEHLPHRAPAQQPADRDVGLLLQRVRDLPGLEAHAPAPRVRVGVLRLALDRGAEIRQRFLAPAQAVQRANGAPEIFVLLVIGLEVQCVEKSDRKSVV